MDMLTMLTGLTICKSVCKYLKMTKFFQTSAIKAGSHLIYVFVHRIVIIHNN